MKKNHISIVIVLIIFSGIMGGCDDNDATKLSEYNGIPVTIVGDRVLGYKFHTDFDAVLIPVNMYEFPDLNGVRRALISFNLSGNDNITQLESGKTYNIILNSSGLNFIIPTFENTIDTLSYEYRTNGQDSITTKNKKVHLLGSNKDQFYIKTGYMNIVSQFDYDPAKPVNFLIYYDGEKDVDILNKKVTFNLYFNNNISTSGSFQTNTIVSFKMSENIFNTLYDNGYSMNDSVDIYLKANT